MLTSTVLLALLPVTTCPVICEQYEAHVWACEVDTNGTSIMFLLGGKAVQHVNETHVQVLHPHHVMLCLKLLPGGC